MAELSDSGETLEWPVSPDPEGGGGDAAEPAPGELVMDASTPVHPSSVTANAIVSWIATGVMCLGILVLVILSLALGWWPSLPDWLRLVVWSLVTVFFVWLSLAWPRLEYRYLRYSIHDVGLVVRRGVVWRKVVSVPRSRVQHTDVSQGPIQRRFGLATLTVHTAGTEEAAVAVEGLAYDTALALRDFLLEGREGGADG